MKKISITGDWLFSKEEANSLTNTWEQVQIPHTWNNIDGQDGGNDYYRGLCYYKKTISIEQHTGRVYLEFEGVNSSATVYLNSVELGTHQGGYSTFRFDISDYSHIGDNELLVGVSNTHDENVFPLQADFTFYGGIYRKCHIIYTNQISFDLSNYGSTGVKVIQQEVNHDFANLVVQSNVMNDDIEMNVKFRVTMKDDTNSVVAQTFQDVQLIPHSINNVDIKLTIDQPHLWNGVEDPYLYDIVVELVQDDTILDDRVIPTGLRYFHMDETGFYLNGTKTRLHGVSRHQDWKGLGNAISKSHHDRDIDIIKEMGANSIRLAHYQHDQYFYDLCDKEGFIVWAEIPYLTRPSKIDKAGLNPQQQLTELIYQNYNHSSIIFWGIQNEITMLGKDETTENIVEHLHHLAKELDPYRLTTQANLLAHPVNDSMNTITDALAYNLYFGWYVGEVFDFQKWLVEFRNVHPSTPICISEYGVEANEKYHTDTPTMKDYTEEYQAWWHEKAFEIFEQTEYVWGTYIWNMFSFGSDRRDEGGVKGINNKGIVNFDRTVKRDAYYYYKAKWSKEPMVHLTSKRFVDRHEPSNTLKAYSNLDYVEFRINGIPVESEKMNDVVFTANVILTEDENHITVVAGDLSDEMMLKRVSEKNAEYIAPASKREKLTFFNNVKDWFEDEIDIEKHLNIDKTYYSIEDQVIDLVENPATLAILEQYFPIFFEKNIIPSIESVSLKFLQRHMDIPKALLSKVNQEFQKHKK